jgi:hypothetical protein
MTYLPDNRFLLLSDENFNDEESRGAAGAVPLSNLEMY